MKETKLVRSFFSGVCPHCQTRVDAILEKIQGIISPPSITVCCSCEIPVVPVTLHYQG